jgi:hypothetical protein
MKSREILLMRNGDEIAMKVNVGEAVVVDQTDQEQQPWGVWQFPTITRLEVDLLEVSFNRTVDSAALDSASKINPAGACTSSDRGRSWQRVQKQSVFRGACTLRDGDLVQLRRPRPVDAPRADLPEPCLRDHGYNGVYAIRDPLTMPKGLGHCLLERKPAGSSEWEQMPATIDDPDGGVTCYDPPDADHTLVNWWHIEQVIQIPDGSLLATVYGFRLGQDRVSRPKWESYCLRSTDEGRTWVFHSVIARDDNQALAGFTEPRLAVLPDGSLLAILRTECAQTGPMYRTRSIDGGKTWGELKKLCPFGVLPQPLTLENGVTVLAYGRPGVHLLFSSDGKGEAWENPTHLVVESFEGTGVSGEGYGFQKGEDPKGRPKQTRTSGYTSLVATGRDSFLIAYDQFDYPNADGAPRKTILVREITVASNGG